MTCDVVRPQLEAFVDRELSGAEMLRVSQHLESCEACARETAALADLGQMIRGAAECDPAPQIPAGLAAGVIARVGAEAALSWRATFSRAVEDWHWAVVGAGSVAATFVSAVIVAVVVMVAPASARSDSLAALMANLQGSPGTLYIEGRRVGIDPEPVMLMVKSGAASYIPGGLPTAGTEADLVLALLEMVDRGGVQTMSGEDRKRAEELLDRISAMRAPATLNPIGTQVIVYSLRLSASTGVSAKALNP